MSGVAKIGEEKTKQGVWNAATCVLWPVGCQLSSKGCLMSAQESQQRMIGLQELDLHGLRRQRGSTCSRLPRVSGTVVCPCHGDV
jgi:hypothetical protein